MHAMRGSPSCMGKGRLPTNALCGQGSLLHECTQPHCTYCTDMHARHLPAYSRTCAYCTDDTQRLIRAHSGRVRFGHVGVGRQGQAVRTCQCMSPVLNPRVVLQKHAGRRCRGRPDGLRSAAASRSHRRGNQDLRLGAVVSELTVTRKSHRAALLVEQTAAVGTTRRQVRVSAVEKGPGRAGVSLPVYSGRQQPGRRSPCWPRVSAKAGHPCAPTPRCIPRPSSGCPAIGRRPA